MRNVFPRLVTQSTVADSDDDRLFVCVSFPHHEVTDAVVPVQAPELHILSDAEPRAPVRLSRRVASVPEHENTPHSFQDMHPTSSHGAEQDPCQDTLSMHQGPSPEGRDVVARVGPPMTGWDSLHGAMQVLGIRSREGLAEWVHAPGFPQPRWGAHFSGRAQERLLNAAAAHDARVTGLESAYVHVILQACEHGITEDAHPIPHRRPIETHLLSERRWVGHNQFRRCVPEAVRSSEKLSSPVQRAFAKCFSSCIARTVRRCCRRRSSEADPSVESVHAASLHVVAVLRANWPVDRTLGGNTTFSCEFPQPNSN